MAKPKKDHDHKRLLFGYMSPLKCSHTYIYTYAHTTYLQKATNLHNFVRVFCLKIIVTPLTSHHLCIYIYIHMYIVYYTYVCIRILYTCIYYLAIHLSICTYMACFLIQHYKTYLQLPNRRESRSAIFFLLLTPYSHIHTAQAAATDTQQPGRRSGHFWEF
jgi:hypothetical protein